MKSERNKIIAILAIAIGGLIYTFVSGNEPKLGLDLQGGLSVVLEPQPAIGADGEPVEVTEDSLDEAVEIMRRRVDSLGVAEPEVTQQGGNILVQLPGVDDPDRALEIVGQTAELRFRPVLDEITEELYQAVLTSPDATTDDTTTDATTADSTTTTTVVEGDAATDDTTTPAEEIDPEAAAAAQQELLDSWELTIDPQAGDEVVLPQRDDEGNVTSRLRLGPAELTGEALETASAQLQVPEWVVRPIFKSGAEGIDAFNILASECFNLAPTCPTKRIAIEIDDAVESAPTVQVATFERDGITISVGAENQEAEAKDLAIVLRSGALPVDLQPQETRTVSATLGTDALVAGIIAGLVGLFVVSAYLIAYYRRLGVVAILSLLVSSALLWVIVSFLGESRGLALTLAGVTGLIVSIGVSVDSNIVYFEHLKEDVRSGRTLRSAVDRSFEKAFSTIVKADMASLISAVVLYVLTVGAVKGFALFLGLATILDLIATYFFMGPLVRLMVRRENNPAKYGILEADIEKDETGSWFSRAYRGATNIDFPAVWRKGMVLSVVLVVISLGSLFTRQLNLGIEFEGGTSWEVSAPDLSVAEARDALRSTPAGNAKIQIVGSDIVRVRSNLDDRDQITDVRDALAEVAGTDSEEVSVTTVGPTWGDEITSKALTALIWFFVIVAGYIAVRLEWKMAVGALVAVAHDIIISVGVYSVFQFEVTPATVIAFLTIMGYSLYDTIVVFDRAREVAGRVGSTGKYTYPEMMNLSLNQTLMRSINTSFTSILPVLSMLVIGSLALGALTLREFAIALLVGLIVGAYSSVIVASWVVTKLKEREPASRAAEAKGKAAAADTPTRQVDTVDSVVGAGVVRPPSTAGVGGLPGGGGAPRPRKKKKRR